MESKLKNLSKQELLSLETAVRQELKLRKEKEEMKPIISQFREVMNKMREMGVRVRIGENLEEVAEYGDFPIEFMTWKFEGRELILDSIS